MVKNTPGTSEEKKQPLCAMASILNGMEKVYKTKIAIWLICAIIGFTVIPIIPVLVYDFSWIVVTIVALILFFALFSLFDIRYTIHNNILSVKCGMLSTTNYDINQIRKIKDTNSILAAPAASLDRIAIYFIQQKTPLIISPKDKKWFHKESTIYKSRYCI